MGQRLKKLLERKRATEKARNDLNGWYISITQSAGWDGYPEVTRDAQRRLVEQVVAGYNEKLISIENEITEIKSGRK